MNTEDGSRKRDILPARATDALLRARTLLCRFRDAALLRRRLARRLQVLRVPRDVALEPVLLEAGTTDRVRLAGVDNQLRVAAQAFEALIQLLSADDRHVHIGVAAEDERRRHDLVHAEERRDLHPDVGMLPRQTELRLPLPLI